MPYFLKLILCILGGYAIGMLTTGVFVAKTIGNTDIRKHGSGSVGTTNVLRTLGWMPSLMTLAGDTLKGLVAALIGYLLLGDVGMRVMGFCAILGHVWPVSMRFKGGKGIATTLGVLLFIDPVISLCLLAFELVFIAVTRYVAPSSVLSCTMYFILSFVFHPGDWLAIVFAGMIALLVVIAHRENIGRLLRGTENRLDFKEINKLRKRSKE